MRFPPKKGDNSVRPILLIVDKFHQPTAKSKAAPFEAIDLSIYKPSARCLAFSTSEDRLLLWIVAFQFQYYEVTGNATDYTVI